MTKVTGLGEAFFGTGAGDWYSLGEMDTTSIFELSGGEYVIPQDTVKKFTQGLLDVTGAFTGSFQSCYFDFWESGGPDKDGWESRAKWDR